jgi:hypothetical protein
MRREVHGGVGLDQVDQAVAVDVAQAHPVVLVVVLHDREVRGPGPGDQLPAGGPGGHVRVVAERGDERRRGARGIPVAAVERDLREQAAKGVWAHAVKEVVAAHQLRADPHVYSIQPPVEPLLEASGILDGSVRARLEDEAHHPVAARVAVDALETDPDPAQRVADLGGVGVSHVPAVVENRDHVAVRVLLLREQPLEMRRPRGWRQARVRREAEAHHHAVLSFDGPGAVRLARDAQEALAARVVAAR